MRYRQLMYDGGVRSCHDGPPATYMQSHQTWYGQCWRHIHLPTTLHTADIYTFYLIESPVLSKLKRGWVRVRGSALPGVQDVWLSDMAASEMYHYLAFHEIINVYILQISALIIQYFDLTFYIYYTVTIKHALNCQLAINGLFRSNSVTKINTHSQIVKTHLKQ